MVLLAYRRCSDRRKAVIREFVNELAANDDDADSGPHSVIDFPNQGKSE